MTKATILFLSLLLITSSLFAAEVSRVKGKAVLLKNASDLSKGSRLKLKDNRGKVRGYAKVTKVKGSKAFARLLKGKAKKGWSAQVIKRKSKSASSSKSSDSSSNSNSKASDYFSAGGGIYSTSADNYDRSLLMNLEYGMKTSMLKNLTLAGSFLYSTEVLDDTTFAGVTGNFSYKQTTMHFIAQAKYQVLSFLYLNLSGGYFMSSGNMTNIATSESLKLEMSGFLFGFGGSTVFDISESSFIELSFNMYNYTASSVSFNGTEQENISSSDRRTAVIGSYGLRF